MAGSSRPAVLIYRQQCKKPFTKRLTGNWGQPYNPPPRQQSAPGRAAALLFDIVDLEGIRGRRVRSEEHTSELQSLMRISYAVFCLKKKNHTRDPTRIK